MNSLVASRLFGIPRIRLKILELLLNGGSRLIPLNLALNQQCDHANLSPQVLRTCKLIYNEGMTILYGSHRWLIRFYEPTSLVDTLRERRTFYHVSHLVLHDWNMLTQPLVTQLTQVSKLQLLSMHASHTTALPDNDTEVWYILQKILKKKKLSNTTYRSILNTILNAHPGVHCELSFASPGAIGQVCRL